MKEAQFIVLFVDDQPAAVEPLMDYTQSLGFKAICLADPVEAMELIKHEYNNIIVVISDFEMGDVNGLQFRGMMLPRYQEIPFLIYSGFIDEPMLRHGLANKVSAFVDKPFDFGEFEKLLTKDTLDRQQTLLEKRTLRRTFIDESFDLLEEFEHSILAFENNPQDHDSINNIFRIVHTIKGGSGVLDWPEFTRYLHIYEDLLAKLKTQQIPAIPSIASKLLKGYDFLSQALKAVQAHRSIPIDLEHWTTELGSGGIGHSRPELQPGRDARKDKLQDVDETIKMPTRILDEFMELSGEITVIRNTVNKLVRSLQNEVPGNRDVGLLSEYLDEMHKINSSMQSKITELRKVSIQSIFKGYPRTIRDLCLALGKDIELKVMEDGLRIDTRLAHVLSHSLIHLIRNSADHGIETPAERRAAGKPERGTITLQASEVGEDIVVAIQDDGRGIHPDVIGPRAVQKGVVTQAELDRMSDKQIFKIIFEPGFSTVTEVTDISGRGVGMDMVRASMESVGGRIDIDSKRGEGSTFTLRLPIPKSVLIIQSLRVRAGSRPFNIPQDQIVRLMKIDAEQRELVIKSLGDVDFLDQSGHLYQLVDLKAVTQGRADSSKIGEGDINIALVRCEGLVFGLIVDAIEDAEEVVVKRLAPQIRSRIFLGSTFLGDGQVGLILDTQGIAAMLGLFPEEDTWHAVEEQPIVEEPQQDFLVFHIGVAGCYALPLAYVYRLEDLDPKTFARVGGLMTAIYRDRILPLTVVHEAMGLSKDRSLMEWDRVPAIVCEVRGQLHALLVSRIVEIIRCPAQWDTSLDLGPCITGSVIYQEKVLTALDLYQLLGLAPDEPAPAEVPAPAETSEVQAWGLF